MGGVRWIFTIIAVTAIGMASGSVYKELLDHVTNQANDPYLPPIFDVTKPLMVRIRLGLQDISNVDRANNEVDISLMASVTWNSSITWNPCDFHDQILISLPRERIWQPRLTVLNAASSYKNLAEQGTTLFSNGLAGTLHQYRVTLFCELSAVSGEGKGVSKCNASVGLSAHGSNLIHLDDPNLAMPSIESFFKLSRHQASAFPLQDSRNVRTFFSQSGLPDKKERIDLEFSFREPRRHGSANRFNNFFKWF